jgi:hypothetical protein
MNPRGIQGSQMENTLSRLPFLNEIRPGSDDQDAGYLFDRPSSSALRVPPLLNPQNENKEEWRMSLSSVNSGEGGDEEILDDEDDADDDDEDDSDALILSRSDESNGLWDTARRAQFKKRMKKIRENVDMKNALDSLMGYNVHCSFLILSSKQQLDVNERYYCLRLVTATTSAPLFSNEYGKQLIKSRRRRYSLLCLDLVDWTLLHERREQIPQI